jgi:transposase InsO family protein
LAIIDFHISIIREKTSQSCQPILVRSHRGNLKVRLPHGRNISPSSMSAPNQVWSWDITKLLGPTKWTYFYLYVIMHIFSRYVVGWMVAHRESATLARQLITETCLKQSIPEGQLTLHADRGSSVPPPSAPGLIHPRIGAQTKNDHCYCNGCSPGFPPREKSNHLNDYLF